MLQHEPVQGWLAEHAVVHWPGVVDVLHEAPASPSAAQSLALAQPHVPPPVTATHFAPTLSPVQSAHDPPDVPHVVSPVPPMQAPALQQPPLQSAVAEQVALQT